MGANIELSANIPSYFLIEPRDGSNNNSFLQILKKHREFTSEEFYETTKFGSRHSI